MDTPSSQHPVAIEVYNTFLEYRSSKPPGSTLVPRAESLPPRFPQMIAESPDLQAAAAAFMATTPEFQAAVAAYARSPALSAAAAVHPSVKSPLQASLAPGDPSYLIRSPLSQVAEADSPRVGERVSIPPTPDIGYSHSSAMYGGCGLGRMLMMPPPPPAYLSTGSSILSTTANQGHSLPPPAHTPLIPSAFLNGQSPPPPAESPVLAEAPRSSLLKTACNLNGSLSDAASAFDDLAFWSQTGNEVKNETLHEGSAENSDEGEGEGGPAGGMPPQPSAGSRQHGNGKCKPCAFYHKKGCDAGLDCTFCHMCEAGEKKRRRQLQRFTIKQRRMRREARLAEEAKELQEGDEEGNDGGGSSPSKSKESVERVEVGDDDAAVAN